MTRLALMGGPDVATGYETATVRMPHVRFTAVVDRDARAAEASSRIVGAAITARTFEELITKNLGEFEAVVIHKVEGTVGDTVIAAARAGKHVLVNLPMTSTPKHVDRVIESCREAGVRLMVGLPLRFMPSQQAVKAAVDAGKLGDPGLLRIHAWGVSETRSKDILRTQTINSIDLALWMLPGFPTTVYAVGRDGYVQVHLGFPEGGMALIDYASTPAGGEEYFSLSLIGSKGAAYADDHHNRNLLFVGGMAKAVATSQGAFHLIEPLREFVTAIEGKRQPTVTADDFKAALHVTTAAVTSLEERRTVNLTGDAYEPA